jgi:hypothetical protein
METMIHITHQQVIELVKTLPAERLSTFYDFARFLKESSGATAIETDLFDESIEDIAADEAWWDEQFVQSEDTLLLLAKEAVEEYRVGKTTPLDFDERHARG